MHSNKNDGFGVELSELMLLTSIASGMLDPLEEQSENLKFFSSGPPNMYVCVFVCVGQRRHSPRTRVNKAFTGLLGRTILELSVFPVSLSSVTTDESFVATIITFFSKPWKLHVSKCIEIIPVQNSLAMCLSYKTLGPSGSINDTCTQ